MTDPHAATDAWPGDIYDCLKQGGIRQVAYVPDAGHARLLNLCDADDAMHLVPLTTEEEGIALLSGAWLGGERGVLLMQSSGVGNCINMLSLARNCRMPLLTLITMRGTWGEFNPWQVPMGQATPAVLKEMGVMVLEANAADTVGETVAAALRLAFEGPASAAVLLSQRLIGAKSFASD